MTCAEARLAMVDAEPAALDPAYDSALARHLGECAACRADAAAILARTTELRSALAATVAAHTGDAAATRAAQRALYADRVVSEAGDLPRRLSGRARARRITRVAMPLLAAAAVAALLLVGGEDVRSRLDGRVTATFHVPEPEVPAAPVVNAGAGRGVAVMRTADPRITVVWTF